MKSSEKMTLVEWEVMMINEDGKYVENKKKLTNDNNKNKTIFLKCS